MKKAKKKKAVKRKPSEHTVQAVYGREFTGLPKPLLQLFKVLTAESPDFAEAEELVQQGADVNGIFMERDAELNKWKQCTALGAILYQHYLRFRDEPPADGDDAGETILQTVRFFLAHGLNPALEKNGFCTERHIFSGLIVPSIVYYPWHAREASYLLLNAMPLSNLNSTRSVNLCITLTSDIIGTYKENPNFASLINPLLAIIANYNGNRDNVDFYFLTIGKQIRRIFVEIPEEGGPVLQRIEISESSDSHSIVLENAFLSSLCLDLTDCFLSIDSLGPLSMLKSVPLCFYADITDRFPGVAGCTITDISFTKAANSEDGLCDTLVHLDNGTVLRFVSVIEHKDDTDTDDDENDGNHQDDCDDYYDDIDFDDYDIPNYWGNIQIIPPQSTNSS